MVAFTAMEGRLGRSSADSGILQILRLRAGEEMLWANTSRIVASVTDDITLRNVSVDDLVRGAVGVLPLALHPHLTVSES